MNRAIGRRTAFETRADLRYFLAQLAREARSGRIELHAYCVLGTHYHLLARSPRGELAEAMRRVQNAYVRWFNRTRRRDGPLFRGRYLSRLVRDDDYRRTLVRYIDFNAVEAGLVGRPDQYPFCSARWYATTGGPRWLTRTWVEGTVARHADAASFDPRDYPKVFGIGLSSRSRQTVERAILRPGAVPDDAIDLVGAAPERVREWMERKAMLADGTGVGLHACDASRVAEWLGSARRDHDHAMERGPHERWEPWKQIGVALLHDLSAESYQRIAHWMGCSPTAAWTMYARHCELLTSDPAYSEWFRGLVTAATEACMPETVAPTRVGEAHRERRAASDRAS
jgi:REP element-mobilizing transposase RayT